METEYLAKFAASGRRETTVVSGVHYSTDEERQKYIDDGYIPISDDDYQHYVGNRGAGDNGTCYRCTQRVVRLALGRQRLCGRCCRNLDVSGTFLGGTQ